MKIGLLIFILLSGTIVQAQLTLADIFASSKYTERQPENLKFMKNDQFYTVQEGNAILKKETVSGRIMDTLIARTDTLKRGKFSVFDYRLSESENMLLLEANRDGIYRRSFNADYIIYNLQNKSIRSLNFSDSSNFKISHVTFSPDGNKIAYTFNNNLFIIDLTTNLKKQITFDGRKNYIINGSTDWVYEEEFEFTKAFEWSPDSKYIAYLRFDETHVPEYTMQKWGALYPENYVFKYPKAGERNSKIELLVFSLDNKNHIKIPLDSIGDYYVPRFRWIGKEARLAYLSLNRSQTQITFSQFSPSSREKLKLFSEKYEKSVEIEPQIFHFDSPDQFFLTGKAVNEDGLFFFKNDGKYVLQKFCERNDAEIEYADEENGLIYFVAAGLNSENWDCYRLKVKNKKLEKLNITDGANSIHVSESGNYYIITNSASGKPSTFTLFDAKSKNKIRILEDNRVLRNMIQALNLPRQEFFTLKTSEQVELRSWMIKPSAFDSSKTYPLIMFVYGGPGSQMVRNAWAGTYYLWFQYLTNQGFIVACADGRGTGGKETAFRSITYEKLGELETRDQIEAARYFGNLPYIDKSKIGIWGWSFGGYLSTMSLLLGNNVFRAGIAVAPVTSWRFYDTIYTERYLNTPQENSNGYDQNSPLTHASMLKGKYLLIHGTSDDNVHLQNTIAMQESLIKAGRQFDTFIYPNKSHGISGGNTRLHLFTMMLGFWNENLK